MQIVDWDCSYEGRWFFAVRVHVPAALVPADELDGAMVYTFRN